MIKVQENLTLKSCRIAAGIRADEIAEAAGVNVISIHLQN